MSRTAAYLLAALVATIALPERVSAAPVIIGTYYEETVRISACTLDISFACSVPFTKIKSGNKLTITRIACNLAVQGQPMQTALFIINRQGAWERMQPLTPAYIANLDPLKFYGFNTQTSTVLIQGSTPVVWSRFAGGNNPSMDCQIAGEIGAYP